MTDDKRKSAHQFLLNFFEAEDALDAERLASFFTPEGVLRFANTPPVQGREEITKHFGFTFNNVFQSMSHTIVDFDVLPEKLYVTHELSYVVKGDTEQKVNKVPIVNVFWKKDNEDLSTRLEVYMDPSPVFERMREINAANGNKDTK